MQPIMRLVYVSAAKQAFSEADLDALLDVSRRNNARIAVTGLLLYNDGNFMQALEGEPEAVERLATKIQADPRHHFFQRLVTEQGAERLFPEWAMAYRRFDPGAVPAGYSDFLQRAVAKGPTAETASAISILLNSFRRLL